MRFFNDDQEDILLSLTIALILISILGFKFLEVDLILLVLEIQQFLNY